MMEKSGNIAQPPTAIELRRECLYLVERLYRHPLNIKLLLAARSGLLLIAGYKAGRSARFAVGKVRAKVGLSTESQKRLLQFADPDGNG